MHPKTLISIDYLIINLKGDLTPRTSNNSLDFELHLEPFGTKTFANKNLVKYKGEQIGFILSNPRSSILDDQLNQFQFENHVFYSKSLTEIRTIIYEFTDFYNLEFTAINRLDIAYDINDNNGYYRDLANNVTTGKVKLAGRKKSFSTHNELVKGVCINNGFNLGSRSSTKFLRVYNKSLSLEIKEKQHIIDFYKANDFENQNVWRFEYQLNASFFNNLKAFGYDKDFFDISGEKLKLPFEDLTWSVFDYGALINLTIMAQKNFFELRTNTGKSQTNKEESVRFILDFEYLLETRSNYKPLFVKLKRTHVPSVFKRKRLAKALFREYCANFQNVTYIVALNRVLDEINPFDGKPLKHWFINKMSFYLAEFRQLEKMNIKFDYLLYKEQNNLFIE
ncbi:replication initiation factor domain-containing protein [Flavobacterium sp. M31R6]|uniref:replication initiation factor domain-containing protein n=1 Tax=Flavobacterium sp. M31R6 TaxID=2739062 RepID=UPI0015698E25|nr:replication initiation factor domain-containing protein [Flavobacterium sp. M31R6]QKJ63827.1 replication initiation factor domain-containing protein [Flavobacterium sp. M31R6]